MLKIGIITGSTRPNRKSPDVAKWALEIARKRGDAEYELVDIKDFEQALTPRPRLGRRQDYASAVVGSMTARTCWILLAGKLPHSAWFWMITASRGV